MESKKLFCILALAFGALSFILGMIGLVFIASDLIKKLQDSKANAMSKMKKYVAEKLDVVKVEPQTDME